MCRLIHKSTFAFFLPPRRAGAENFFVLAANLRCLLLMLTIVLAGLAGCGQDGGSSPDGAPSVADQTRTDSASQSPDDMVDALESAIDIDSTVDWDSDLSFEQLTDSGVNFLYYGNPSPELYMTEQNGGGVAIFDFDCDGWSDLFFTNGDHFDRPAAGFDATHHLYRNQAPSNGGLRFSNVASPAGLATSGFGMGVAAGDVDNDGFSDLLICYYGKLELWANNGDGTFANVTEAAGIFSTAWSASAAFADLDEDGDLDLYVANYVQYSSSDPPCFLETAASRIPISCSPMERAAQHDCLWENLGDGVYWDASESAGLRDEPAGKGLAVEIVDLDGDGRLDIYVANDTTENFLLRNEGGLKFRNVANQQGVSVGQKGTPESSMGIGCADFDHDGRFDLFVTNFENAINDLYLNVTESGFLHASASYGLDLPSRPMLAFGTVAADFDLDRWPDLFVANGHIWDLTAANDGHQYQMTPQLFRNESGQRFEDASRQSGTYFTQKWLGRSAATGDLDNDGVPDLVVSQQLAPAAVLRNTTRIEGQTLTVQLIGRNAAREPLGIRVIVHDGEQRFHHHLPAGGSYQASSSPQVIVPTKLDQKGVTLEVIWGGDRNQIWTNLPTSGHIVLTESRGQSIALP